MLILCVLLYFFSFISPMSFFYVILLLWSIWRKTPNTVTPLLKQQQNVFSNIRQSSNSKPRQWARTGLLQQWWASRRWPGGCQVIWQNLNFTQQHDDASWRGLADGNSPDRLRRQCCYAAAWFSSAQWQHYSMVQVGSARWWLHNTAPDGNKVSRRDSQQQQGCKVVICSSTRLQPIHKKSVSTHGNPHLRWNNITVKLYSPKEN